MGEYTASRSRSCDPLAKLDKVRSRTRLKPQQEPSLITVTWCARFKTAHSKAGAFH